MKQQTALDILKSGKNVFLTGSAGAGKTYTLNQYIHYLKARRIPVAITASTGIAATHMNGMTIHTWSGIGIKDSLDDKDLKAMAKRQYLVKHLENVKVLIIDEVSMLHAKQFAMVDQVLQYFKENEQAFGGIQVIVAGDFFQLPPVGSNGETNKEKFCFMSPAWVNADFKICYLTEQFRQIQDDANTVDLNDILNEIRSGSVSVESINVLQQTANNLSNGTAKKDENLTRLYTHNADVNSINNQYIQTLEGKGRTYKAKVTGNDKLLMTLTNSVRAPEELLLKKGTKVMFVKNNFEAGYSNGSLGEVIGFYNDTELGVMPEVKLKDGSKIIATPETWSVENEKGNPLASFTQIPLCYAWAITVHKSQGMTLEQAEIDLSQTFEAGQGYVALSRLKSLDGLRLLGFNERALQLDPLAIKADRRFLELSDDIEAIYQAKDEDEMRKLHTGYIIRQGGTNSEYIISQYSKDKGNRKKEANTTAKTKELLLESLSISEIAAKRELAESTIVNHIAQLLREDKNLPLDHIKPEKEVIEQVRKAYKKVQKRDSDDDKDERGNIKLRPIFEVLKEEVPYNLIRLALVFIV